MTGAPFLLLQISDTHLGATWDEAVDPEDCLRGVVAAILELPQRPDALLVSGDLTTHGGPADYARVRELLEPLGLKPQVIPGNHDLRGPLREAFGLPGAGDEHTSHTVDLGPLRLLCVDSIIPGADGGALDEGRIEWIEAALSEDRETPTVIALHHPPLLTGIPGFEEISLAPESRTALGETVARHPQVARIVAGHVHRPMVAELAGRAVLTAPSTYMQSALDFEAPELAMGDDPRGFAIHALRDGKLTSHVQTFRG
jgi:3',5'-cyclic-AMP phosphodiesterase